MEPKVTILNILKGGIVMPFNVNNNFNNNQQGASTTDKKKTNFKIGKIWGSDGQLEVGVWVADMGVLTTLRIKSAIGKDPSTGANVFEQKMPGDLPSFYMNINFVQAFLNTIDRIPVDDIANINFMLDKGSNGGKLTINGDGNTIKITIDSNKQQGSRTMTFEPINTGVRFVHASFITFCEYMRIAYKKALYQKLDPEEFAMAVGNGGNDDNDDLPI